MSIVGFLLDCDEVEKYEVVENRFPPHAEAGRK